MSVRAEREAAQSLSFDLYLVPSPTLSGKLLHGALVQFTYSARFHHIEKGRTLPAAETVHFGGHWVEPGVEFSKAIARAAGCQDAKIRATPWLMVRLTSPFVELFRELLEMRYLWQVPLRLDNTANCGN